MDHDPFPFLIFGPLFSIVFINYDLPVQNGHLIGRLTVGGLKWQAACAPRQGEMGLGYLEIKIEMC